MTRPANHYETLEVSPLASAEVIRAAYRSLMQRFHPDRNPGDPDAAIRAADVARAYEVLSDARQRATYDASLQPARPPAMPAAPIDRRAVGKPGRAVGGRAACASRSAVARSPSRRLALPVFPGLLAVAVVAALWLAVSFNERDDPVAELASIRRTMASAATAEADKRRLYARKLAILEQQPALQRSDSAERTEDMAARTFTLLASPLVVRLAPSAQRPGPALQLTVPVASVVVGSFDASNLLAHMANHRERLVQDAAARLAASDPGALSRPDGNAYLKRAIADAVTASLATGEPAEYPSTYFESPGRYGVTDVLLLERFRLVQIEAAP